MTHACHAHGCAAPVPAKMFACRRHWFGLRKATRDAIWREYRPGQENDKHASLRYLAVQRLAVAETAFRPNDEDAAVVSAGYMAEAVRFQGVGHRRRAWGPAGRIDQGATMKTTPEQRAELRAALAEYPNGLHEIDTVMAIEALDDIDELAASLDEYKREVERRDEYLASADARVKELTDALAASEAELKHANGNCTCGAEWRP